MLIIIEKKLNLIMVKPSLIRERECETATNRYLEEHVPDKISHIQCHIIYSHVSHVAVT